MSLITSFWFFNLKRFPTSLIMFYSIVLFFILSDDIGLLFLGKSIGLAKGICFLGLRRGIGLGTLNLGMGIGI